MISTHHQALFDEIVVRHGGAENLSRVDLEVVVSIVKNMEALRSASPVDAPRIAGTVAKLMGELPPKPEGPALDYSRLSDEQLDELEAILAVASGEKPKIDLSALSDEQLSILRRARRIMDGKDSGPEPETNDARERIVAKLDTNGTASDAGEAAKLAAKVENLEQQVAVLLKLNADLEQRLAMELTT